MSFLEKNGVGRSVPVPVVPIKFLRVPNLFLIYITIYILNSYKDIRKGYCPKNPFWNNWNNWNNWNAFFLPFEIPSSSRKPQILLCSISSADTPRWHLVPSEPRQQLSR